MPRRPRLSGAETVRALERPGFVEVRQSGSRVVLRRGPVGCVVPLNAELEIGTLAGAWRQAQVGVDEFVDALR